MLAAVIVAIWLSPLMVKEYELKARNVKKSPRGTKYAEILDSQEVRLDYLPCGNLLAPPPAIDVSGQVLELNWIDETRLNIVVSKGSRIAAERAMKFGVTVLAVEQRE